MGTNQEKYEVATVVDESSPVATIQQAIASGADLDKLEKLMLLQERWEANEAKKAYVSAMAAFKANPPKIEKTKQVRFTTSKGTTEYKHALLADAAEKINKELSKNGLSAAWTTHQQDSKITVTCTITHSMGHSESTSLTASPDESGGKNSIQAIGSTISYLERYSLFALTGLASHDMDDDGQRGDVEYITGEQENELHSMIIDNNLGEAYLKTFAKFCKAESLAEIPAKDFKRRKAELQAVISKVKK